MSLISTRLAVICLTFPITATMSAQPVANIAGKAQKLAQSSKQVVTLFDLHSVGNSGGVNQTVVITGPGYAGTPDDRRLAGRKIEPDEEEVVAVIVRDAKDPVLSSCFNLLVAEVFMEHTVRISGIGHVVRRSPDDGPRQATLQLDRLSECTAVPLR